MSANPTLPTLDVRLSKMDDLITKLGNQMFAIGLRQSAITEQIATVVAQQQAASDALLLLQQEAEVTAPDVLPLYQPVLVGPTTQTVLAVTGAYLKLEHVVFYNASISWSVVPSGGSAWYLTGPGNIYSRSGSYSPSCWGYVYNASVGLTSEFRGQVIPSSNVISTLTQGWGTAAPGSWVGGGLVGTGSNISFQGWYIC